MCRWSAADYERYARTSSKPVRSTSQPRRSLVEIFRDLFRPRRPQVREAEVVAFPAGVTVGTDGAVEREGSKAA